MEGSRRGARHLAGMKVTGGLRDGVEMSAALLAAMRGDLADADVRLDAMNWRETTDDLATRTWYLRLRSVVELLRGDLERAYDLGMEAVHADPAGMNTPTALWDAARAALWMRDAPKVREALDATAPLRGRWVAGRPEHAHRGPGGDRTPARRGDRHLRGSVRCLGRVRLSDRSCVHRDRRRSRCCRTSRCRSKPPPKHARRLRSSERGRCWNG